DPGVFDDHQVSIDWGDGSSREVVSVLHDGFNSSHSLSLHHFYLDDQTTGPDSYSITIEVVDDDEPLNPSTASLAVNVNNVAPTALALSLNHTTIAEGGSVMLGGSFADPGTRDTHRVTIAWGDGTTDTVDLAAGMLV